MTWEDLIVWARRERVKDMMLRNMLAWLVLHSKVEYVKRIFKGRMQGVWRAI